MTPEQVMLLEACIDQVVEMKLLDGTWLLVKPLFVYTGEDNPDVFVLPVERLEDGTLIAGKDGRSILLDEIDEVRAG